MRVLIIEDDEIMAQALALLLASAGIICDIIKHGKEGLDAVKCADYDIILLDLMLPDVDGFDVLLRLRASKIKIPVLILSGLGTPDHKVRGFGFGADDYLTKPFNRSELIARIQAIVRRSKGHAESVIRIDKITINLDTRIVEVGGIPIHLTSKEYAILELLAIRRGSVLTKEMFLNNLYGGIDEPELKIIDVFVCKLRKKLAQASGGTNYIDTVWGRGYMLKEFDENTSQIATQGVSLKKNEDEVATN